MMLEGRVGLAIGNDGAQDSVRLTRGLGQVVQAEHGKYYEAVFRGNVYTLSTAVAGVTVASANVFSASPLQPLVGIFNPVNSGVNVEILNGVAIWTSGTPGTGGLVWTVIASAPVTAAGTPAAINNKTFALDGITRNFVNAAMTGSGAGNLLRYQGGPTTGALAANANQTFYEDVDGAIICPPGGVVALCAGATGTNPIVQASMTYELVPI